MSGTITVSARCTYRIYASSQQFPCFQVAVMKVIEGENESGASMADEKITVAGTAMELEPDSVWQMSLKPAFHPKYGKQYSIITCSPEPVKNREGLIRFFSGKRFAGIGPAAAAKIADTLGENALEMIKKDPSCLEKTGLTEKQRQSVIDTIKGDSSLTTTVSRLLGWGLGEKDIRRLQEYYKETDMHTALSQNCYEPVYRISGFGIEAGNKLANGYELPPNDPRRLQARVYVTVLNEIRRTGSTYVTKEQIYNRNFQGVNVEDYKKAIDTLDGQGWLLTEGERIYQKYLYFDEKEIASKLHRRIEGGMSKEEKANMEQSVLACIQNLENRDNICYDLQQKQAIVQASLNPVQIINGGPGTGKSTVIKGILAVIAALDPSAKVRLCAPTGRAAKRMSQVCGQDARTIHSVLRWKPETGGFEQNEANKLDCDYIIIDEFSMVNTHLFASLLKALQNGCRLILVGDENQLESIEPGKVFADLIESNEIPVVRLENVYRQRQGSGIPLLARQIAKELPLEYSPEAAIHDVTEDKAVDTLLSIVENSPFPEDLHILAPKYEGKAEVDEINYILQQKLNPEDIKTKPQIASNRDIKLGDQKIRMHFRLGDKVMLIKNNPELKVYNGDIGIIEDVDVRNKALTVCFDNETRVEFQGEMLQELRHAWCTTVHKAQGQEYAHVIVMAPRNSFSMQKKRLLYTAITRAKKQLDIIGIRSDFEYNVKNKGIDNRHTSLQERIEQAKKAKDLLVFDDSEFIETEFDFDYNE